MDELKNFISQNRDLFDTEAPSVGHLDRFAQMLQQQEQKNYAPQLKVVTTNRLTWQFVSKIAAVLVVSFTLGVVAASQVISHSQQYMANTNVESVKNGCANVFAAGLEQYQKFENRINPESAQAQRYFASLVGERIDQIESMTFENEEQKEALLNEISGMDQVMADLQKQLKASPNDPKLINAMIQHYQAKIKALNTIINSLNNVKQLNSNNNESVDL
ncbi:MAG: hypothetical protein MJ069_03565 [Salinivirgaceae bacterium]|nr:hypothetical protein [Salinivirgaceae bacterium]